MTLNMARISNAKSISSVSLHRHLHQSIQVIEVSNHSTRDVLNIKYRHSQKVLEWRRE